MFAMLFTIFTLLKYSFHVRLLAYLFKSSDQALYKGCVEFTNLQIQLLNYVIQCTLMHVKSNLSFY